MTSDMKRIIYNQSVYEQRGRFIVSACFRQSTPVITVWSEGVDGSTSVRLSIDRDMCSILVVPSLSLRLDDPFWISIVDLFGKIDADWDDRHCMLQFDSEDTLMTGIDCFLNKLEGL